MATMLRALRQGLRWRQREPPTTTPSGLPQLPEYFERPREERLLEQQFEGLPRFTTLLGSATSGKSALLSRALQHKWPAVAYVDLRQNSFADWGGFYMLLSHHFSMWTSAASTVERAMPQEVTLPFGLGGVKYPERARHTIYDLSTLLSTVSETITQGLRAEATGSRPRAWPVLVVDDAHKLSLMALPTPKPDDPNSNGELALQTPQFHVVFASSDSFFLDWLSQYLAGEASDHFVIGDLDRDAAERYYAQLASRMTSDERSRLPPFAQIHSAAGGRMADIRLLARQFVREQIVDVDASPAVLWEEEYLRRALYPAALGQSHFGQRRVVMPEPPAWQSDQATVLFERFRDDGFIPMGDAIQLVGGDWRCLRSLIEHQMMAYRPCPAVSPDLPEAQKCLHATVVPRSPLSRYAMQRFLQRHPRASL